MRFVLKVNVEKKFDANTGRPLDPRVQYEIQTEEGVYVAFLSADFWSGELRPEAKALLKVLGLEIPTNPLAQAKAEVVA